MQPVLFKLNRATSGSAQRKGAVAPLHGIFPLIPTATSISGVSRDSSGVALAGVTCTLFKVDTQGTYPRYTQQQVTVSDGLGNYSFIVGMDGPYRVTFDLAGSPALAGISLNVLAGIAYVQSYFVSATGGTITTDGDYRVHTFTSSGVFNVTSGAGSNLIELLVVGGGGGGGSGGGGGGAGEHHSDASYLVSTQQYTVTVGAGGANGTSNSAGSVGNASSIAPFIGSTITAAGGGFGGARDGAGGSGASGGGSGVSSSTHAGGAATAGFQGGGNYTPGVNYGAGGGGGAGGIGQNGSSTGGGDGGLGLANSITGASVNRAGGGGGGTFVDPYASSGGSGVGGNGGQVSTPGATNTGSGGGAGSGENYAGSPGASGVVIFRYKFQ